MKCSSKYWLLILLTFPLVPPMLLSYYRISEKLILTRILDWRRQATCQYLDQCWQYQRRTQGCLFNVVRLLPIILQRWSIFQCELQNKQEIYYSFHSFQYHILRIQNPFPWMFLGAAFIVRYQVIKRNIHQIGQAGSLGMANLKIPNLGW